MTKEEQKKDILIHSIKENCYDIAYDLLTEHDKEIIANTLTIDMETPMHFTDEQKAWVKNYIIINAKRQRTEVFNEIINYMKNNYKTVLFVDDVERLKDNTNKECKQNGV